MMTVKKGQILEIEVSDVAFGGKGLARIEGLAVFIDQAVKGDRVKALITRRRKSYAEARVLEILVPSSDRIEPPCPYSGSCGGCKWQFLRYAAQIDYKRRHVAESLAHIGGLPDVQVHPTLPADPIFGYRNKMEFSCSDHRWLMPEEMKREDIDRGFALGLHVPGTYHKVLDTKACLLQPDFGNELLNQVRDEIRHSGRPPYGLRSHQGFWRFLMLRHSVAEDRWMVNIVTSGPDAKLLGAVANRLLRQHAQVAGVVNNVTARKAAIAVGESETVLGGEPRLRERIGRYTFEVSANSFFQTNTRAALRLYRTAQTYARLTGTERIIDLYCGTGTISIFMAEQAREVWGIELGEGAVADARRNSSANGVANTRFVCGDARHMLSAIDFNPEVLLVDPPRDGLHPDVVQQVLALKPQRVVYISCNPATLARDLAQLKVRYRVAEVQPVDMFPHTWHIESVARLELENG
jgi:23S rRNA (uracil1939-C5)-methyltransferase